MCIKVSAQTVGTLSFSCSTDAPSGNWGDKHTLAIWIEDTENPSNFIKTNAKYGHDDDHLTSWSAKSGRNLVDAETGATLSSYTTRSIIWDGTDVSNNVVADGTYKVFIEMGWGKDKQDDHAVASFEFNKGAAVVQETLAGNSNFSDVKIEWKPTVTMVDQIQNGDDISVFPNPTTGIVNLDFKNPMHDARVIVESETGSTIYRNELKNDFKGSLKIDISNYARGIYFVKVVTKENQFVYKLLLDN
jgi:hypothetical protein